MIACGQPNEAETFPAVAALHGDARLIASDRSAVLLRQTPDLSLALEIHVHAGSLHRVSVRAHGLPAIPQ